MRTLIALASALLLMQAALECMSELPPPNPRAMGLHLTDAEWRAIYQFLMREPRLRRVLIYGSRLTGIRRTADSPGPPDIDLGVELDWPRELGGIIELGAALQLEWREYWLGHRIHVDWHGCGAASDAYRAEAVQIWPGSPASRPNETQG